MKANNIRLYFFILNNEYEVKNIYYAPTIYSHKFANNT